ncbi:hypothetical protein PUV54_14870 [Hyphococcus flavus]|uniref:Uncharacterized protein n=1 Tax=Hyphococcus flavus TaxID=1866326 RepID=A0AAE9ZBR0_9PROT|nr:hypothetical protein [Hyphococcus flavus]WDI31231.1 hypothetical protein PUV54_14870 [Hyphococcus flavus]
MTKEKEKPPIEPFKSYVRGLAVPGIIILGCAVIGAIISILNGNTAPSQIWGAVKFGGFIGFFISMVGVFEMAAALLFADRRLMNGVYMTLGYLTVWSITAYALGIFDGNDASFFDLIESKEDE